MWVSLCVCNRKTAKQARQSLHVACNRRSSHEGKDAVMEIAARHSVTRSLSARREKSLRKILPFSIHIYINIYTLIYICLCMLGEFLQQILTYLATMKGSFLCFWSWRFGLLWSSTNFIQCGFSWQGKLHLVLL